MKKRLILIVASLVILATCAFGEGRPIVLVFDTVQGEGATRPLAASATKALRNYFRDTQRVQATIFDRESPAITRAIIEKKLTPDEVASYSSEQEKLRVAGVLLFGYACGSEITMKDKRVTLKMWVTKVGGGKNDRWEATGMAGALGEGAMDLDNALQSAASAAVNSIARRAFITLPLVTEPDPSQTGDTTAIGGSQVPEMKRPTVDDYVSGAEKSLKSGNIALAIQQYSRAVDADPTNPGLRLKLADAYSARGMYDEAETEVTRAEKDGAGAETIAAVRDRLQKLRKGIEPASPSRTPQPDTSKKTENSVVYSSPDPSIAKIVEGDKLWTQAKPDEAADAYRESVRLNPNEWRAWERLAIVNASMALFGESRKALEQLRKLQPDPTPAAIAIRYEMLRKAFDRQFTLLLNQYDDIGRKFTSGSVAREDYYNQTNGLALRLESMAKFLDAVDVPEAKKIAHSRRSLACGLIAQAAASLIDYLETNSPSAKSNAAIFAAEARKELQEADKLETSAVTTTATTPD